MIPYAKAIGSLLVLGAWAGSMWLAYDYGGSETAAKCAEAREKDLAAYAKDLTRVIEDRDKAQAKADELAALPPKVVTLVRENPSHCTLPAVVADSLRAQVRKTNAALP